MESQLVSLLQAVGSRQNWSVEEIGTLHVKLHYADITTTGDLFNALLDGTLNERLKRIGALTFKKQTILHFPVIYRSVFGTPPPPVFYFAYGSNMNEARMRERQINFTSRQPAMCAGYQLVFNKAASFKAEGYANIIPSTGSVVYGILYELSQYSDLESLDRFEATAEGNSLVFSEPR